MHLRRLVFAVLVAYAGSALAADEFIYTVQLGDHPWNIAQRYLKNTSFAQQLSRLNRITNDRQIAPGTELRIPAQWLKLQSTVVRVLAAHGDAMVNPTGSSAHIAANGETLQVGSRLRTGPQSSAMLEFDDGSRVLVHQSSELRLVQSDRRLLDGGFMVELELLRGGLENAVTPHLRPPQTRFEIRTPAAVAAVRGTNFRVHADPDTTWTEVLRGAVDLGNTAGAVQAQAGFGTLAKEGKAPEPPRLLLPAPDLDKLPARLERLPFDWPLTPVAGAVAYRTELAPDTKFDAVLSDETSPSARTRVQDIADGNYILRVRAIDANGLEGLAAERPLLVYARPQAPALINPAPHSEITSPQPEFRWAQVDPSWSYRLEIRRSDAPEAAPLHAQSATSAFGTTLSIPLAPGDYLWRVASVVPATGRQGPWGDPQGFSVLLPAPELAPVQVDPGHVTIHWPALSYAAGYDLQIGTDAEFVQPLVASHSTASQQELHDLAPGAYQLRLRTIRQDGVAGPWGRPQSFVVPEPIKPEPTHWQPLLILIPALILLGL